MVLGPTRYAIGGFPCFMKKSFKAVVKSSCCVVSISAAKRRSCFRAATGTQKGIAVRPALSGRFSVVLIGGTVEGALKTPVVPSCARAFFMLLYPSPVYNPITWLYGYRAHLSLPPPCRSARIRERCARQ